MQIFAVWLDPQIPCRFRYHFAEDQEFQRKFHLAQAFSIIPAASAAQQKREYPGACAFLSHKLRDIPVFLVSILLFLFLCFSGSPACDRE